MQLSAAESRRINNGYRRDVIRASDGRRVKPRRNRGGDSAGGVTFPVMSLRRGRGRGRRRSDGGNGSNRVEIRTRAAFEMLRGSA
jgi:hypothetical protein